MRRKSYGYFILLTSKSDKEEVAHGLDAGADDFLTKPVNAGELRARISAGARILGMERELTEKNRLIKSTLDELQVLYDSLDSDLIEAKKLQQSLVRERHRDFGPRGLPDAAIGGHVGGDLVGMFPTGPRARRTLRHRRLGSWHQLGADDRPARRLPVGGGARAEPCAEADARWPVPPARRPGRRDAEPADYVRDGDRALLHLPARRCGSRNGRVRSRRPAIRTRRCSAPTAGRVSSVRAACRWA